MHSLVQTVTTPSFAIALVLALLTAASCHEDLFPDSRFCVESFEAARHLPRIPIGVRVGSSIPVINNTPATFLCLSVARSSIVSAVTCTSKANSWWYVTGEGAICRLRNSKLCLKAHTNSTQLIVSSSGPKQAWNITHKGVLQMRDTDLCVGTFAQDHEEKRTFSSSLVPCESATDRAVFVHKRSWTLHPLSLADLKESTLFNFSFVSYHNKAVYLYTSYGAGYPLTTTEPLFMSEHPFRAMAIKEEAPQSLEGGMHVQRFEDFSIHLDCEFTTSVPFPRQINSAARYYFNRFSSVLVVCELPSDFLAPQMADSITNYTPKIVLNGLVIPGQAALRVLPSPLPVRHRICACLAIWRRWSYLLEYLTYHTRVHDLGHTILIVQDEDTLAALPWLRSFFSIDAVFWPYIGSQPAMAAHCSLLSKLRCEWTMQSDVDEILFIANGSSLSEVTQALTPDKYSIVVPRHLIQMFSDEEVIAIPPGGVMRNYLCKLDSHQADAKQIIRIDNVHESFANYVHWFMPGDVNMTTARIPDVFFLHFAVQAWELYRLKYLRSADVGEGFNGLIREGISLSKPEPEYLNFSSRCTPRHPWTGLRETFWKHLSYKEITPSGSKPSLLLTGSYGENAVLDLISQQLPPAKPRASVVVGAKLAIHTHQSRSRQGVVRRFRTVIQLSLSPLQAIGQLAIFPDWSLLDKQMPRHPASTVTANITRALYHWTAVTQLMEMYVDRHYRVSDLLTMSEDFDKQLAAVLPPSTIAQVQTLADSIPALTWQQLADADAFLSRVVCAMALRLDYSCDLEPQSSV
eukprot:m.26680 g.26680  ORF g.26680 m.26680 type:complete len:802 (+) comp38821_c0_seq1:219-2624(+)